MSSIDSESLKAIRSFFLTKIMVFWLRGEVHEDYKTSLAGHQIDLNEEFSGKGPDANF